MDTETSVLAAVHIWLWFPFQLLLIITCFKHPGNEIKLRQQQVQVTCSDGLSCLTERSECSPSGRQGGPRGPGGGAAGERGARRLRYQGTPPSALKCYLRVLYWTLNNRSINGVYRIVVCHDVTWSGRLLHIRFFNRNRACMVLFIILCLM